jgi:hypothetical protein
LRCLFSTVGGALGGAVLGLQAGAGFAEVIIPGGSTTSRLLISLTLALLGGLGGAASGAVLSCFGRRDWSRGGGHAVLRDIHLPELVASVKKLAVAAWVLVAAGAIVATYGNTVWNTFGVLVWTVGLILQFGSFLVLHRRSGQALS